MKRVLIADDEKDILDILEYTLSKEGYQVTRANDGEEAYHKALELQPDLVVLDIMMPKRDGIEVCRLLRENPKFSQTFIVILTARSEEYSEVAGFDAGADDYITKPIKLRSLMSRLEALQRRIPGPEPETLTAGPFRIDRSKYLIVKANQEIKLPKKEFELLFLLVSHKQKVVTRDSIFQHIWGKEVIVVDRTIDVHIRRLRKKIGENFIQTVKGVGYKFVENP